VRRNGYSRAAPECYEPAARRRTESAVSDEGTARAGGKAELLLEVPHRLARVSFAECRRAGGGCVSVARTSRGAGGLPLDPSGTPRCQSARHGGVAGEALKVGDAGQDAPAV